MPRRGKIVSQSAGMTAAEFKGKWPKIAKSKPEIMGKTKACYSAIQQITSIYKKLATS
jgi:hypothetical protein